MIVVGPYIMTWHDCCFDTDMRIHSEQHSVHTRLRKAMYIALYFMHQRSCRLHRGVIVLTCLQLTNTGVRYYLNQCFYLKGKYITPLYIQGPIVSPQRHSLYISALFLIIVQIVENKRLLYRILVCLAFFICYELIWFRKIRNDSSIGQLLSTSGKLTV